MGTWSLSHHTINSFLQNFINKHFRHPIFLGLNYFSVFPQETFNCIFFRKPVFGVTSCEFPWEITLLPRNLFIFIWGGWKTQFIRMEFYPLAFYLLNLWRLAGPEITLRAYWGSTYQRVSVLWVASLCNTAPAEVLCYIISCISVVDICDLLCNIQRRVFPEETGMGSWGWGCYFCNKKS